jgi:hypothetical protein
MTSLDDKLSALLASHKSAEAILSEMTSEVKRVFPRQLEPARDLIVEFLLEKAITNRQHGSEPINHGKVINFLEERGKRKNR